MYLLARHEFVSAVILKIIVSQDVTHFSWVDMNQCFRIISWFSLQGRIVSCVGEGCLRLACTQSCFMFPLCVSGQLGFLVTDFLTSKMEVAGVSEVNPVYEFT